VGIRSANQEAAARQVRRRLLVAADQRTLTRKDTRSRAPAAAARARPIGEGGHPETGLAPRRRRHAPEKRVKGRDMGRVLIFSVLFKLFGTTITGD
jgi:hypothetical protein